MVITDIAHPAGKHDRLVVAAHFFARRGHDLLLVGAKIAAQIRPAEFIVKRRRANRPVEHDLACRSNTPRSAMIAFPGLGQIRQLQIGNRKTAQPGLGFGTAPGRAFVADLATGAGGRAGKRRNRGRMIVGFHFHQNLHRLGMRPVFAASRLGMKTRALEAFDHRRIVAVSGKHAVRMLIMGVANHAKQGVRLFFAVDDPVGVENFVPTVLGIGLREHHQFNVGGIAAQHLEILQQIINFIVRQRQPQFPIGHPQSLSATTENIHHRQRRRIGMAEQRGCILELIKDGLGHAIM